MNRREAVIREKYAALAAHLTERGRRIWAATEAKSYGRGGITAVYRATGITDKTIRRGVRELQGGRDAAVGRIRQRGGGRKRLTEQDPTVVQDLERLVDPLTRGDPESPLWWTSKSTYHLSEARQQQGHPISQRSVYNLLRESGYTLQANRKRDEGASHLGRLHKKCSLIVMLQDESRVSSWWAAEQSTGAFGPHWAVTCRAARGRVGRTLRAAGEDGAGAGESHDEESGVGGLGVDAEKKTFRAAEQDPPAVQEERAAYQQAVPCLTAEQFICVAETGSHLDLARLYAWAPAGQRAYAVRPRNRGRTLTCWLM